MKEINEIIGNENAQELREEFNDILCNGGDYEDVEDLLLDYGLEMDYIFG